jgi:cytochrome c peroxidase
MKNTVIAGTLSALSILVCLSGSAAYAQLQPGELDLNQLHNYANQLVPEYINGTKEKPKDNTGDNPITDEGATLGRVLFYDKKLSVNHKVSCASCHKQEHAFSDPEKKSQGVAGLTQRHSMRLINTRFAEETRFRWDEAAETLEEQMTIPIRNKVEMGYSGTNGNPDFDDLIEKLKGFDYYPPLFKLAFGDPEITEERMQLALAQFVRSIQSFDSKYDVGRAEVETHMEKFPNFTAEENAGKSLFTEDFEFEVREVEVKRFRGTIKTSVARRIGGDLNCATCHQPPEFDIDPDPLNNGFDRGTRRTRDYSVTRSPSLRDLINPNGALNGPMFHGGTANNIIGIKAHYNFRQLDRRNTNLDKRMTPGGRPQFLDITSREQQQLFAFLRTLTGSDVYENEKWSNPFDGKGKLVLMHSNRSP